MILFQKNGYGTINYKLSTNPGQSGGIVVFFPTGDINEPHIVCLHDGGYFGSSDYFGFGNQYYFADKFNLGIKITEDVFVNNSKLRVCFCANGYYDNDEKFDFLRINENHFLFSTEIYLINKWKFVQNYNK